jgi:phospholipase C
MLISPFAKSGAIVHDVADTSSVVRFIETVFGLRALATLPDERPYMPEGPRDTNPRLSDLLGGLDVVRLDGKRAPIPASTAIIQDNVVNTFPAAMNCRSLHLRPVRIRGANSPPPNFSGLPKQFIP